MSEWVGKGEKQEGQLLLGLLEGGTGKQASQLQLHGKGRGCLWEVV